MNNQVNSFINQLKHQKLSKSSVKNYKTDINQFSTWLEKSGKDDSNIREAFSDFQKILKTKYKNSTYKRKHSSLTNYIDFVDPIDSPFSIKESHSKRHQRNAVMIGLYSLAMISLLITIPEFIQSTKTNDTLKIPANLKAVQTDTYDNISHKELTVAVSAPDIENQESNPIMREAITAYTINSESSNSITSNSSGKAIINKLTGNVTIFSEYINEDSVIIITPTTNTNNQVLYISDLKNGNATVSINNPQNKDISFNWFILNNKSLIDSI